MLKAKNAGRRWTASLVVLTVSVTVQALAYGFTGGTGESNDPYQIATADDLISIGCDPNLLGRHYVFVADIDLTGRAFAGAVIAPDTDAKAGFDGAAFTGRFDGRGHKITGLAIAGGLDSSFLGLFGRVGDGGEVLNLGLENATVSGGRRARYVGGLAGDNGGLLRRCFVTGAIAGQDWSEDVAGLAGVNTGTISQCHTVADVSVGQRSSVAGLTSSNAGVVSQCYATGGVSAGQYSNLVGLLGSNSGVLSQCYTVSVLAQPLFSTRTGLAQSNTGLVENCYFLRAADGGGSDNGLGTALSSGQMKQAQSFAAWDCYSADRPTGAWWMPEQGYPVLAWQTLVSGLVWLPQVRGASSKEAQALLADAGLVLGSVSYDFDPAVPADKVIALVPGHPVAKGAVVDVLVSLGAYDWKQNTGDGSKGKPYQVSSAGQLECIGQDSQLWSKSFVLTGDIDLTGRLYTDAVIASYPNKGNLGFTGVFDGRGYWIFGLAIASGRDYAGLFGYVSSTGVIQGLRLEDASVLGRSTLDSLGGTGALAGVVDGTLTDCSASGSVVGCRQIGGLVGRKYGRVIRQSFASASVSGNTRIGGLAGYIYSSSSSVSECSASGNVHGNSLLGGLAGVASGTISQSLATGIVSGDSSLGGLVGSVSSGTISQCFAMGGVLGKDNLGGLVGYAYSTSTTSQSFATGNVAGNKNLGGLVGIAGGATVTQCYATGGVSGGEGVGGLAGNASAGTIDGCYAAGAVSGSKNVGGLIGTRTGDTTACFWDVQTSGQTVSAGGTGLTTAQMQTAATFTAAGWDFGETWLIWDYPHFQWEIIEPSGN